MAGRITAVTFMIMRLFTAPPSTSMYGPLAGLLSHFVISTVLLFVPALYKTKGISGPVNGARAGGPDWPGSLPYPVRISADITQLPVPVVRKRPGRPAVNRSFPAEYCAIQFGRINYIVYITSYITKLSKSTRLPRPSFRIRCLFINPE